MKLHNDKSAFEFMLNTISNRTGIRSYILKMTIFDKVEKLTNM